MLLLVEMLKHLYKLNGVNMLGGLFIRNHFFHINHIENWWKCDGGDRDGDDAPNFYLTIALPNCNAWRGVKVTYFGSTFFCMTVKKCQKLYKLNELHSVTEVTLNKGIFPPNPEFLVLYSNFVQNQVTAPCNNRLAWHVLKDCSSVSILLFCKF